MISCRRAAELISQELDADLPLAQRVLLGVHTMLCSACRRYRRQLVVVEQAVEDYFTSHDDHVCTCGMPDSSKERLKAMVKSHLDLNS